MKIAVVGAGAIGGYLGAKLSLAGEDVTFIARNKNLAAINANGFKLILEDGSEQHAEKVRAVQAMADAGPQDAVLLTLKAHQVKDVLPDLRALFGPETMVVTMINGLPWWYFHKLAGPYEGRQLESVDPGGVIAERDDPSSDAAAMQVDTHTRADLHRRFEMFGNEVVERLVETRHVGQDSGDRQPVLRRRRRP